MPSAALDRVNKIFPLAVRALRDFSLTVEDGELLVLVGPSGCGKTTALRVLAGLETPSSGRVLIGGVDVTRRPPRERDTAMVFQKPAIYPHLSVRRNLEFSERLRQGWPWPGRSRVDAGAPSLAARVAEIAHLLELDDVLERRATELSGGQQQRVALGRALVRRPALCLLDEPFSQLDARLRADLRRQLHLLQRQFPVTMLYVTHDPVEAMILADRVAVLDRGAVQQVGKPREVYHQPANRSVAAFFGWPAMNLVDGIIVSTGGTMEFVAGEVRWPLPSLVAEFLRSRVGQAVTLGLRPEHVRSSSEASGLRTEVVRVEEWPTGAVATLRHGSLVLTALLDDSRTMMQVGERVDVALPLEQTHWFDHPAGRALFHGERPAP
jgi:multiple sugar transport system ATP-binding protein